MRIDFRPRRSGKTTELVHELKANPGAVLLTASRQDAQRVMGEHGLSHQQVWPVMPDLGHRFQGAWYSKLLVDDAERLTPREFQMVEHMALRRGAEIKAVGSPPTARLLDGSSDVLGLLVHAIRHGLAERGVSYDEISTYYDLPRCRHGVSIRSVSHITSGFVNDEVFRHAHRGTHHVLQRFAENKRVLKAERLRALDPVDVAVDHVGFDRQDIVSATLELTGTDTVEITVLLANDCEPQLELSLDDILPTHRLGDLLTEGVAEWITRYGHELEPWQRHILNMYGDQAHAAPYLQPKAHDAKWAGSLRIKP